jgi:hypothetical protein
MASACHRQLAGSRVEAEKSARQEETGSHRHQEIVDTGQDVSRVGGDIDDDA